MTSCLAPKPLRRDERYVLALLFFAPILVLFANIASQASQNFYLAGDTACIESGVLGAAKGVQYLGPYSRFGWNNPGPLYFYTLLPFYWLSSMGTQSLYASAVLINIVSVLTVLYCLVRNCDSRVFFFAAFCFSLYLQYYLGLRFVRNIWDPNVTVLPFAAFTFLSATLSLGNLRVLPLSAFALTFLVQTRVGYAPVALWMFSLSLLLCGIQRSRGTRAGWKTFLNTREFSRAAGVSVALFAVLWALPIAEAVRNPPGNLGELARFFLLSSEAGQPLSSALQMVSNITNEPLARAVDGLAPGTGTVIRAHPVTVFALQVALGIGALSVARAHGHEYGVRLVLLSLSSLAICVFSVTRIPGAVNMYLIRWMSVLGLIHWCAIGFTIVFAVTQAVTAALSRTAIRSRLATLRGSRLMRPLVYLPVCVVSAALFIEQRERIDGASSFEERAAKYEYVGEISNAIEKYVEREKIRGFLIKPNLAQRLTEAGVFNQLHKASVPFYVEDKWLHWVGHQFAQPPELSDTLVFTAVDLGEQARGSLVYHSAERSILVYHKR